MDITIHLLVQQKGTRMLSFLKRYWPAITLAVGIIAVIWGICWFVFGHWWDTDARFWQSVWQFSILETFFPNGWNVFQASWFAYIVFGVIVAIIGYATFRATDKGWWIIVCVLGGVTAIVNATIFPMWLNNMMPAASMSAGTVVTVEDFKNAPPAMTELINKAQKVDDTTMRTDVRGYTTTIKQAKINLQWETRPSSAKGAEIVMRRSGDSDTNSTLLGETLSYHSDGRWTAIRDGQNYKSIASVTSWDGVSNDVQSCRFDGANELRYAFNGMWSTNLADLIVSRYPDRLFDMNDVWGECKDGVPSIVVPTTIRVGYGQIRAPRFGGAITVKGSPSGEAVTELVTEVAQGQFSGPVYPSTLVAQQRNMFDYAAGILANWNTGFGTETSTVASQTGNPSEYLLKSKVDGHMYWVTPLRPNKGDSQQIIGYNVVSADVAKVGELNSNQLYFFAPGDSRAVDLDRLYNTTIDAVNVKQAAFFTGNPSGTLTEFLPASSGLWQAFAERGGRVVYRIDVATNSGVLVKVISIDKSTDPTTNQPETKLECGDATKLDKAELRKCIEVFLDELEKR